MPSRLKSPTATKRLKGRSSADIDGDGNQDLVTVNGNTVNVSILLGNGAGSFSAATNFGPFNRFVAVGDFNLDGIQDLAVGYSDGVAILLGNGVGWFWCAYKLPYW